MNLMNHIVYTYTRVIPTLSIVGPFGIYLGGVGFVAVSVCLSRFFMLFDRKIRLYVKLTKT